MTLGKKLKEARKQAGLSQEQLSEKLGVSRSAVAKWETDNGIPDVDNLKILSKLLNISIDYLLDNGEIDPHRITYHKLGHDRYIFVPAKSPQEAKYLYYEYDWKAREIRIFEREQMRAEAAK